MTAQRIVAIALVSMALAQAQPASTGVASWENLQQLKAGQRIKLVQKDLQSWDGLFVSASDDSLALRTSAGDKTVARGDVLRVSRHGGKRLRNALIGAAIAGGIGFAVGAAAGGCSKNGFGFCPGRGVVSGALGGVGIILGGGVGAAFPGSTLVYRAPAR